MTTTAVLTKKIGAAALLSAAFIFLPSTPAAADEANDEARRAAALKELESAFFESADAENASGAIDAAARLQREVNAVIRRGLGGRLHGQKEDAAWGGGDSPEVVIVEFFDYQCGYCRQMTPTIEKAGKMAGVRVIIKEYPILGEESVRAAKFALAAAKMGKGREWHFNAQKYQNNDDGRRSVARNLELDFDELKAAAEAPGAWDETLKANARLANIFQFGGTPAFLVGRAALHGAVPEESFLQLVEQEREKSRAN